MGLFYSNTKYCTLDSRFDALKKCVTLSIKKDDRLRAAERVRGFQGAGSGFGARMVYRSLAPELHLDWINVLLWSLEFVCVAVALVSATRNIFLISDLIEDQVNEWDYCKTFRWWARFEMPACAAAAALFFLHGYWWLFLPHAAYTAYLAYLVYAKKESDGSNEPKRSSSSAKQSSPYMNARRLFPFGF